MHKYWTGRSKTVFLACKMVVYEEDTKDSTKELLELIHEFSKFSGYEVNIQKLILFTYTSNEHLENNF